MSRKIALVTGAGKRIGADIALRLAREGYGVALLARASIEGARAIASNIVAAGGAAWVYGADLTAPEAAAAAFGTIAREIGPVELLVNNAAIFETDSIAALDLALWRRQFAVNLEAPVFLAGAFAAALPETMEGCIVNVIDQRVLRLTPQNLSYTLAKSALWTATQTLAQALAPRVRVNAVGPGPTYPSLLQGEAGMAKEAAGALLGRSVRGGEIGDAVVFLASARNVTGQLICVDAGQHLAWRTPDIVD
jgi:NAD(P)-dependent dehydrogenase (short-subunit alcohol dehydrogenase family)